MVAQQEFTPNQFSPGSCVRAFYAQSPCENPRSMHISIQTVKDRFPSSEKMERQKYWMLPEEVS